MEQTINTKEEHIELITRQQACEILKIEHSTFFRYFSKTLTTYRNAENPKDQRHFFDLKEIQALHEKRQLKKTGIPSKVIIARQAIDND